MNYDFSLFYQYNDEMEVYLNHDEELDFLNFKLDILKEKLSAECLSMNFIYQPQLWDGSKDNGERIIVKQK